MRTFEQIRTDLQNGKYAEVITEIESYQTDDIQYLKFLCDAYFQSRLWDKATEIATSCNGKTAYFSNMLLAQLSLNARDFENCMTWLDQHKLAVGEDIEYLVVSNKLAYQCGDLRRAKVLGNKALNRKDKSVPVQSAPRLKSGTKKIIAFSLFGNRKPYTHGAIINAFLWKKMAPDWMVRVYLSPDVGENIENDLIFHGAEVVRFHDPDVPPYFQRFLVLQDEDCSRFLCRDVDCRPNENEVQLVREWENSGKNFHVVRNHLLHTDLILAGLWGGKPIEGYDLREQIREFFPLGATNKYGQDQRFLENRVWPLARSSLLIHDENYRNTNYVRKLVGDQSIGGGHMDNESIDKFIREHQISLS